MIIMQIKISYISSHIIRYKSKPVIYAKEKSIYQCHYEIQWQQNWVMFGRNKFATLVCTVQWDPQDDYHISMLWK